MLSKALYYAEGNTEKLEREGCPIPQQFAMNGPYWKKTAKQPNPRKLETDRLVTFAAQLRSISDQQFMNTEIFRWLRKDFSAY